MTDDGVAEVLAAEDRRYEALLGPDLATLERLFDDRLSYAHSSGVRDTKAQYLGKVRTGYYVYRRIDHPVDRVELVADAAIVVGRMTADLVVDACPGRSTTSSWRCGRGSAAPGGCSPTHRPRRLLAPDAPASRPPARWRGRRGR